MSNIHVLFSDLKSPVLADRKAAINSLSIVPDVEKYLQPGDIASLVTFLGANKDDDECCRTCLEILTHVTPDVLAPNASAMVPQVLDILRGRFFWSRVYALQLLGVLHGSTSGIVQQTLMQNPHAIAALVDVLKDNTFDGAIRNEGLIVLGMLSASHEEMCKILAFEGCFEVLLWIINNELGGLSGAGVLPCECLTIVLNMMRGNKATQLYFLETGCVKGLRDILSGEIDGSENVINGVSLCLAIVQVIARGNPDAMRRAAVSTELASILMEWSAKRTEYPRVSIESVRCLSSLLSGSTNNAASISALGLALAKHTSFPTLATMALQCTDVMLRQGAMNLVLDVLHASTDVQCLVANNTMLTNLVLQRIYTSSTTTFDPYGVLLLIAIISNNSDAKRLLLRDDKFVNTTIFDWALQYVFSFYTHRTSAPSAMSVMYCKALFRLILSWCLDFPPAISLVKADAVRSAFVTPLSDPVSTAAALDHANVWYYALGILLVLQLYQATRDQQWRTTVYHDITIPVVTSLMSAMNDSQEWAEAPTSSVASLNTSAYDSGFVNNMRALYDHVLAEMVDTFLQGQGTYPRGDALVSTTVTHSAAVAEIRRRDACLTEMSRSLREAEGEQWSSPVAASPQLCASELRDVIEHQKGKLNAIRNASASVLSAYALEQRTLQDERDAMAEAITSVESDTKFISDEIALGEAQVQSAQRQMENEIQNLASNVGWPAVSAMVVDGTIPRAAVPREIIVSYELEEAIELRQRLADDVTALRRTCDDLLLLLSDVETHSRR